MAISKKIFLPLLTFFGIVLAGTAKAVCPVCTIAVTTCVGLARWLKVDDRITGLWVGGLIVSLIIWTIDYLNRKNIRFQGKKIFVVVGYYVIVVVPLYFTGIIGHPLNECWGIDKLLFGIIAGSVIFVIAALLHNYLKKKNNSKSYFPLQKAVFPVGFLAVASLIIYLIIR
ncbi:MAG: hypothetical protein PHW31_04635 [Candidatus Pacebacteria bacterium]|nr:hypothetical protein [Candidatus Paceibacterota bacterium]